MTQACCGPVLQSSTEQWGLRFALTSVELHLSWLTAHLYEEQTSIGVSAVTQSCCEPVLQSSTDQWGMHFAQTSVALHLSWLTAHVYEEQISAVTQRSISLTFEHVPVEGPLLRLAALFSLPRCASIPK